jgi:uncharacterized protein (DUF169 family)
LISKLTEKLKLKYSPLAILLSEEKPDNALQFKGGNIRGCVAAMLVAATKGRTVAFDKTSFGCPGGGVGLGFGNTYVGMPIDRLLSTGGQAELPGGQTFDMGIGERFFESPEVTCRWVNALPFREIPSKYIIIKPLDQVAEGEVPVLVWLLANADQLSALVTQIGYRRGSVENIVAPWGAACQSILFAYAECEREQPRAVLGFFDISQRHSVEKDVLSLTIPYKLFQEMEAGIEESFFKTEAWQKLQERQ